MYCRCRDCKAQRRKGYVLGSRLLKHLGAAAHHASAYVPYVKWAKGRKRKERRRKRTGPSGLGFESCWGHQ